MLHASNCVLNEEGLRAVRFLEIDGLYPALLIPIDDPSHLISGAAPFQEPAPFGVSPQQSTGGQRLLICPRHGLSKCL